MRRLVVLALCALCAMAAFAQAAKPGKAKTSAPPAAEAKPQTASSLPSNETVESFLKYMFGYDPNIEWKVLAIRPSQAAQISEVTIGIKTQEGQQIMQFFVTADQKWAIPANEMMPFGARPFAATNAEVAVHARGPARGPANAEVTLVEFSDLQCPACKAAHPTIEKLWTDFPNARFIFQSFPLENLHPWAFKAAEYADCVALSSNDAFWKFISLDYQDQGSVTVQNVDEKMKEFAGQAGADPQKVSACVAEPATAARVHASADLAKSLFVNSTPTLFVNGRRLSNFNGMPYETLKQLIQGTPK